MLGVRLFPYSSWVKPILSVHMAVTDRNSHKHWHYLYIILNVSHRFTHHLDITRVGPKPSLILGLFLWRCRIFTNAISTNFNRTKLTTLEVNMHSEKKKKNILFFVGQSHQNPNLFVKIPRVAVIFAEPRWRRWPFCRESIEDDGRSGYDLVMIWLVI